MRRAGSFTVANALITLYFFFLLKTSSCQADFHRINYTMSSRYPKWGHHKNRTMSVDKDSFLYPLAEIVSSASGFPKVWPPVTTSQLSKREVFFIVVCSTTSFNGRVTLADKICSAKHLKYYFRWVTGFFQHLSLWYCSTYMYFLYGIYI